MTLMQRVRKILGALFMVLCAGLVLYAGEDGFVLIALFLPYRRLVNVVYGYSGYIGAAFLVCIIVHDVRSWLNKKSGAEKAPDAQC